MTDNITDNEIIKALECCIKVIEDCDNCPYCGIDDCINVLAANSLDLINRKDSEIEMLKDFIEKDKGLILKLTSVPKNEYDNKIKSEAIKEFMNRLKKCRCIHDGTKADMIFWYHIEYIVKEMTEVNEK